MLSLTWQEMSFKTPETLSTFQEGLAVRLMTPLSQWTYQDLVQSMIAYVMHTVMSLIIRTKLITFIFGIQILWNTLIRKGGCSDN